MTPIAIGCQISVKLKRNLPVAGIVNQPRFKFCRNAMPISIDGCLKNQAGQTSALHLLSADMASDGFDVAVARMHLAEDSSKERW